jgi:hypothetical protein
MYRVSRVPAEAYEGSLSGYILSRGTDAIIRFVKELRTSENTLKIVGDSSLNASLQFSFKNMFIWSPGTLICMYMKWLQYQ